jgi:hypothetical protein
MPETAEQHRARLAYETSLRALEHQRHDVAEVRSRTGILIAAASLGASFLGTRALAHDPDVLPTVTALAALVTTLACGTIVLLPQPELRFSLRGPVLYAGLADTRGLADHHRALTARLDTSWATNERLVRRLNAWFQTAAAALVVQIVGWTVAIVGTLST